MTRVLVTGCAGTIGAAVVRRLLDDPDWEVRICDQRPAPDRMREGCEVHVGDLRDLEQARAALRGCSHVIHLAAISAGSRTSTEACGNDPEELELEHLPSFEVDVQRRWPSVEKAERLLGWRARIGVREGIAGTAAWLRAAGAAS